MGEPYVHPIQTQDHRDGLYHLHSWCGVSGLRVNVFTTAADFMV